jgi:D-glycero-alpha-D-manno-heptose-7-phosphate kinase
MLNAFYGLMGKIVSKSDLADQAITIEQEYIGEAVGSQDQVFAAFGGLRLIKFSAAGIAAEPVMLERHFRTAFNQHLMLFYSGIKRTAAKIAEKYNFDYQALRRTKDFPDQAMEILRKGEFVDFGKLLHEAWQIKKEFASAVTNSEVDDMYAEARAAGALGGKIIGAGGGGFMLLFAPPAKHQDIKRRLNRLIHVPFELENEGSRVIYYGPQEDYETLDNERANNVKTFKEL